MTTWIRNNSTKSQIFCVPYPADKTPLYNLDLLLTPECKNVILCDSIELADANQQTVDSAEIVFTSFICSPGKYDQVDWSPLQDKKLFVLVSNHSGITLETAALKAQELTEFLSENIELESKLLVMPIQYSKQRMRGFDNVDDILKMYQEYPPQINPAAGVILEYEDEIDEFFRKAEVKVNESPDNWWQKQDVPPEEKRVMEEKSAKSKPIDYVMRPLLVRGEVSMLYAKLQKYFAPSPQILSIIYPGSLIPGGIAEDPLREPCRLITGFSCQTARLFHPVKVVGDVVEVIRITVLLMAHQIDRIIR